MKRTSHRYSCDFRHCEGFQMPAARKRRRALRRPASENLQWRKSREGIRWRVLQWGAWAREPVKLDGAISNKTEGVLTAVAEVYNTYAYVPEMREAIARWEAHLGSLLRLQKAA